jgi:hypothetical protein
MINNCRNLSSLSTSKDIFDKCGIKTLSERGLILRYTGTSEFKKKYDASTIAKNNDRPFSKIHEREMEESKNNIRSIILLQYKITRPTTIFNTVVAIGKKILFRESFFAMVINRRINNI